MGHYNRVILYGELTQDPKTWYIPVNGEQIAKFRMAVNRPIARPSVHNLPREQQEKYTDYPYIVCTGDLARQVMSCLGRGSRVLVEGSYQTRIQTKDLRIDFNFCPKCGVKLDGEQICTKCKSRIPHRVHDQMFSEVRAIYIEFLQNINYPKDGK